MRAFSAIGGLLLACAAGSRSPAARPARSQPLLAQACTLLAAENAAASRALSAPRSAEADCEECEREVDEAWPGVGEALRPAMERGCIRAGRGAWSLRLLPRDDPTKLILFYVDDRGSLHEGPTVLDADSPASADLAALYDWDGDGAEEIAVSVSDASGLAVEQVLRVSTWRGGRVRPYASFPREVLEAEFGYFTLGDFDDDGRPDVWGWQPDRVPTEQTGCATDEASFESPSIPWHSRADGTFTSDDEAVARYFAAECPGPEDPLWDASNGDVSEYAPFGVLCARMRGASVAAVRRRIRAEWPRSAADVCTWNTLHDLLSYAEVTPRIRLPGPPSWSGEPAPAASHRRWFCLCYEGEPDDATGFMTCLPSASECARRRQRSSVVHPCAQVAAVHPGDVVGVREQWQPIDGGFSAEGACFLDVM